MLHTHLRAMPPPAVPRPLTRPPPHFAACGTCLAQAGESPLALGPKAEASEQLNTNALAFLFRLLLGSSAGFYYFCLPVYMW